MQHGYTAFEKHPFHDDKQRPPQVQDDSANETLQQQGETSDANAALATEAKSEAAAASATGSSAGQSEGLPSAGAGSRPAAPGEEPAPTQQPASQSHVSGELTVG